MVVATLGGANLMPLTPSWSDFGTSKTWPPGMESIVDVTSKAIIFLLYTTEGTQRVAPLITHSIEPNRTESLPL